MCGTPRPSHSYIPLPRPAPFCLFWVGNTNWEFAAEIQLKIGAATRATYFCCQFFLCLVFKFAVTVVVGLLLLFFLFIFRTLCNMLPTRVAKKLPLSVFVAVY